MKNRRSIRLKGYDYAQAGAYFVTICTQNRLCLFGDIVDGRLALNDAGGMIKKWYWELENKFSDIHCDQYTIMPNHIHCIVINAVGADLRVCPDHVVYKNDNVRYKTGVDMGVNRTGARATGADKKATRMDANKTGAHTGAPLRAIIQWFKTMTTNEYIRGVKQYGWLRFDGKLWQRNYYDRIIRNDDEWQRIRKYIDDNPTQWNSDPENPKNQNIQPADESINNPINNSTNPRTPTRRGEPVCSPIGTCSPIGSKKDVAFRRHTK